MKWYLMVLKKYAVFTGRARRKEYWMFVLFNIIFNIVANILDEILGLKMESSSGYTSSGVISSLYGLAVLIPTLAVAVRRFHDIGKSGWILVRYTIAMAAIILLWVAFLFANAVDFENMNELMAIGSVLMSTALFILVALGLWVWMIVLLAKDGDRGDNKYGSDPKAEELVAG